MMIEFNISQHITAQGFLHSQSLDSYKTPKLNQIKLKLGLISWGLIITPCSLGRCLSVNTWGAELGLHSRPDVHDLVWTGQHSDCHLAGTSVLAFEERVDSILKVCTKLRLQQPCSIRYHNDTFNCPRQSGTNNINHKLTEAYITKPRWSRSQAVTRTADRTYCLTAHYIVISDCC